MCSFFLSIKYGSIKKMLKKIKLLVSLVLVVSVCFIIFYTHESSKVILKNIPLRFFFTCNNQRDGGNSCENKNEADSSAFTTKATTSTEVTTIITKIQKERDLIEKPTTTVVTSAVRGSAIKLSTVQESTILHLKDIITSTSVPPTTSNLKTSAHFGIRGIIQEYENSRIKNSKLKTIFEDEIKTSTLQPTGPQEQNADEILFFVKQCRTDFIAWYNSNTNRTKSNLDEIYTYSMRQCSKVTSENCIASSLIGTLAVMTARVSLEWLYQNELQFVKKGGWHSPENCNPPQQTAIIIPFRDRYMHLPVLLRQLHPILSRQKLQYRIFIIEQDDNYPFNRGKLMNVGYREALKYFPYSCFVFHDIDLLPEDDRISYGCKQSPMHLSVAIDKFRYVLPYEAVFGGIEMFLKKDYEKINGFPNTFWFWGGEDDNLYYRVIRAGMRIHRPSIQIARYKMLKHESNMVKTNYTKQQRASHLQQSTSHSHHDGLSSLQYEITDIQENQLFTMIRTNLRKDKDKLDVNF